MITTCLLYTSLKGAVFAANIYEKLGFSVIPNGTESRHDIIQAVTFNLSLIHIYAIADINRHMITREELREYLNPIYDLERLITRVTYMSANPRDLIAFKNSIGMLPPIKTLLEDFDTELLKELQTDMDPLEELYRLIDASILEEPPISVREGGLIKDGYNENVDKYRHAKTEGKTWLAELEAKEREKTGIKNLKIKFNKVFGYYLEVTNSYRDLVPDYFTRKQTLANAERYITPELKELEDMILGAEDLSLIHIYRCDRLCSGSFAAKRTDRRGDFKISERCCTCKAGKKNASAAINCKTNLPA